MARLTKQQVDEILAADAAERRERTAAILAAAGKQYAGYTRREVDAQLDHAQITAEFRQRAAR